MAPGPSVVGPAKRRRDATAPDYLCSALTHATQQRCVALTARQWPPRPASNAAATRRLDVLCRSVGRTAPILSDNRFGLHASVGHPGACRCSPWLPGSSTALPVRCYASPSQPESHLVFVGERRSPRARAMVIWNLRGPGVFLDGASSRRAVQRARTYVGYRMMILTPGCRCQIGETTSSPIQARLGLPRSQRRP